VLKDIDLGPRGIIMLARADGTVLARTGGLDERGVTLVGWAGLEREAAPSARLRRWYGHQPRRWKGFREKYRAELARQPDVLHLLDDLRRRTPVTLLFSAADEARNNAAVLREMLEGETR